MEASQKPLAIIFYPSQYPFALASSQGSYNQVCLYNPRYPQLKLFSSRCTIMKPLPDRGDQDSRNVPVSFPHSASEIAISEALIPTKLVSASPTAN